MTKMKHFTLDEIKARCEIDTENGCWLWRGATTGTGYGKVKHAGHSVTTHRLALTLAAGEPPTPKHEAAHGECHDRACCNPAHISWKTRDENRADRKRDGTDTNGFRRKLTDLQVLLYKRFSHIGPQAVWARELGVEPRTLAFIRNGRNWKHIQVAA
ncbi:MULTISPECIES: HNH endonuclease [unclassified Paraburkholderia]|uniref:HNH endonuclease n=1 Tax=unclassified Paraburkholderia TaxID=2615204 RepID=UPI00160B1D82|nr:MULTISPECIES: HNH endonuclease [unclassified Paraburkholderia]MBB5448286.1 hypothetical protein [Paraburkholderia sp. WSM4177]MBB5488667.1 hypothetical protein [Paraburkholderia sp. WSM4180]